MFRYLFTFFSIWWKYLLHFPFWHPYSLQKISCKLDGNTALWKSNIKLHLSRKCVAKLRIQSSQWHRWATWSSLIKTMEQFSLYATLKLTVSVVVDKKWSSANPSGPKDLFRSINDSIIEFQAETICILLYFTKMAFSQMSGMWILPGLTIGTWFIQYMKHILMGLNKQWPAH